MTVEQEVSQVVREVVAAETDFPVEELTDATNLEDVAADSLDRLNMLFEIEKRLGVAIRESENISEMSTVGDMCRMAIRLKVANA